MITSILRVLLTRSFKSLVFENNVKEQSELEMNEFGIYIHIPFCTTLCPFCPYNKEKYNEELASKYKEALISEIEMAGKSHGRKNITSVYFGGGTPALMLEDLEDITSILKKNFNLNNNMGIELHPRDIDKYCLTKLKNIGFDMISIGIQSFNKKCLESLGREYVYGEDKVKLVSEAGFKVIDVDLIFGINGQSREELRKDFLAAFKSGATQVSTYPFIDFSYANNKNKPLGRKDKRELLDCINTISNDIYCERTSVWTFGKKNVSKYSSITRDLYIGFGPSAATLTKDVFKVNTFSVKEYIKSVKDNKKATAITMKFSKRTRALYWLFWNAYTLKLSNKEFYKLFNINLEEFFGVEFKIAEFLQLVKKVSDGYMLTKRGAYIYHLMEQRYTHEYIDKTWRITKENPWPKEIVLK
ncbi:radical SAM protein [Clostridium botulinum]|uniref:radical SAM protein n=1 Tax=Clostridium botulinum TaxID=1491 RepID=UPI00052C2971|nr:radical SAM protein [Clostridium botulinum]KGM95350.1 coproporphyrinogen III oxidase [Clostridium botulinum D str. CCUG 7971]NFO97539.1 radical SAM protein [Clostridium botulinum]OOV52931.1 coproporphyrinogen III oxidase [Clostridium botulinum D/C]OOV54713.1 coproporphyrinogen III oxidase [Clostridium botulinum D/C]OOV56103.1 coproporphyrinogen III oxidase [Clostridium botulinum D/C]